MFDAPVVAMLAPASSAVGGSGLPLSSTDSILIGFPIVPANVRVTAGAVLSECDDAR